jgi:hypothetical protein
VSASHPSDSCLHLLPSSHSYLARYLIQPVLAAHTTSLLTHTMADVETPVAATIEINDAVFCTHLKEVVSVLPSLSAPDGCLIVPSLPIPVRRLLVRRPGGERCVLWGASSRSCASMPTKLIENSLTQSIARE